MPKIQNPKCYDLEERTLKFAERVRDFVKKPFKTLSNLEYGKQLIRASSSIGANYIEANECFSKKDFIMRVKICRKESKESRFWLRLIETNYDSLEKEKIFLTQEATELMKIFGSMVEKLKIKIS